MHSSNEPASGYFTTNDGIRLHYLEQGSGLAIVFLPGWAQPASGFATQFTALSNHYRCLAFDYRGHGESERPDHGYRISRLAMDCLDLLNHLDLSDVILLGHSAGCSVIWSFIELFGQQRLRGLILCDQMLAHVKRPHWSENDCKHYGAVATGDEVMEIADTLTGPDGEALMKNFIVHMFDPDFNAEALQQIINESLKLPRDAAAQLVLSVMHSDFRDLIPLIKLPTLCIGGNLSHLGTEVMPWIASQIANAKIAMLETHHFVHLENPEAFNRTVATFLDSIEQRNQK